LSLSYTSFQTAALSYNGFVKVCPHCAITQMNDIPPPLHMELEPVQAAEELKILTFFCRL
jgi:hypothetical protein